MAKDFLVSKRSGEFFVFLFFLFVAATFWMLQTLDETLEKEVPVRLELVDVPEDVVVLSNLPDELRVVVSDKGTSLLHYLRYGVEPVRMSFADYWNGSESGRVSLHSADIQRMVRSRLTGTSQILSVRPDTLEFYFNHGAYKTVPVSVRGEIEVSPDVYLLEARTTPTEVRVCAASSVLDTLTEVRTMPVSLGEVSENVSEYVKLEGIRGAKLNVDSVKLDVTVDVYVEKTAEVQVLTSNFPANKSLRIFPAEAQVVYTVGYAASGNVKAEDFVIMLTYEQILGYQREGRAMIPLSLKSLPDNVISARIEPAMVDYLVETQEAGQ